jgi:hypothetical protein
MGGQIMKQIDMKKLLKTDAGLLRELSLNSMPHDSYDPKRAIEIVKFALNVNARRQIGTGSKS